MEVEFIEPVKKTIKQATDQIWLMIPDEAKPYVPYGSSFVLGALVVAVWKDRKIRAEVEKRKGLQESVAALLKQRDDLEIQVSRLQRFGGVTSGDSYGKTIADLTAAAAEAAHVAIEASRYCLLEAPIGYPYGDKRFPGKKMEKKRPGHE